jgi:hypothetical protein
MRAVLGAIWRGILVAGFDAFAASQFDVRGRAARAMIDGQSMFSPTMTPR